MKQPASTAGEEVGEFMVQGHEAVNGNESDNSNHNDGIKTPRLWLRSARKGDVHSFHAFFSDADVMRYWSGPPFTKLSQSEKYLKDMISSSSNGISDFVIVLQSLEPPSVIGKLGVWDPETNEIGFILSRAYWGKGYMAEAISALLEHLWGGKGGEVPRLIADIDPRNDASLRTLKKFGFREVGFEEKTIETHLGWCDSVYLALENPNWKGETKLEKEANGVAKQA